MENYKGKVKLNLKWYSGTDLYSDGDVEDEILDIVRNNSEKEYNRIISERKSWPVLYHLSYVRTNIVKQIYVDKKMKVLELGSGCGAITGALSEMAGELKCVDLSRKRSLINAERNRDKDNIEIIVGNFEDVEPELPCDFDIITLIGVFEYSAAYINDREPYKKMLEMVIKHLKAGGRAYIAIENRLGLKYFAGCKEDHLGTYFEGIEGYITEKGVRTFSRNEWEEMLQGQGIDDYMFYYPYPDYKFPAYIFSDAFLPDGEELCINDRNLDRNRLKLFDEARVFRSIVKEGMFPQFSNSFLIELKKAER